MTRLRFRSPYFVGTTREWTTAVALCAVLTLGLASCRLAERQTSPRRGLVVSESNIASDAGASMLAAGGNAVDAAIATAFALAVTHPAAGNLGGGGFLVVRLPDGSATSFDFRETAPLRSDRDMFLREDGTYDPELHHRSYLAVGVPGTVAGLTLAHQRLGKLPWRDLLEPAITLASGGFRVSPGLAESLRKMLPEFQKHAATLAQFSKAQFSKHGLVKGGEPYEAGDLLVQADLARTLERIRERGAAGFYEGETAALLVAEIGRGGGLITQQDLTDYAAVERPAQRGTYRGYEIISMPPPSSGGIALIQMLNLLEGYDPRSAGDDRVRWTHLVIETMRRAFADRARYLGDTDFVEVPARLTSKDYAAKLRGTMAPDRAAKTPDVDFRWPQVSTETTHLSVVDSGGTAVSLTTTLEQSFGLRKVVSGAGFLLNNEMGDFNPQAGVTTKSGRIGTDANLVAPRKRMLSSMSPTIVARDGTLALVIGSPGGRTIINTVLQILIHYLDEGMRLQEAIDAPRFHHQWLPNVVRAEPGCFSAAEEQRLEQMGHAIQYTETSQGSAMGIAVTPDGSVEAGVDQRRPDGGASTIGERRRVRGSGRYRR